MEGGVDTEVNETKVIDPQKSQSESQNPNISEDRPTQRVKNEANHNLEEERRPDDPKINIHIFYSPHGTEKDIEGFEEKFREADVFIPERPGWTVETLRILRELSEGRLRPEDLANEGKFGEVEAELDRIIFNSHKPITIVDLPDGHPLDVEGDNLKFPNLQFGPGSLEFNLTKTREYFQKYTELQKKREEFMQNQIEIKVKELIDENPSLSGKKEIHVAMILGSGHTSLLDSLKSKGLEISNEFNKSSTAFMPAFHFELGKKYLSGEPVSDEFVAKTVFELCFIRAFRKSLSMLSRDTNKVDASIAKIVSQFNLEEIKGMFESVDSFNKFPAVFVPRIIEKGFKIPQSEGDMDKLLTVDGVNSSE